MLICAELNIGSFGSENILEHLSWDRLTVLQKFAVA
jgi:hypothetical protein